MSFEKYMKVKSTEQREGSTFWAKQPKVKDQANEEVTISIGIKRLELDDLKVVWGKRLPVCIPKTTTYAVILRRAVEKWSAFDRKFDNCVNYVLLMMVEQRHRLCQVSFHVDVEF